MSIGGVDGVLEDIKFFPEAFAEVLQGFSGLCASEAERICAQANANVSNGGGGYQVEVVTKPRFSFDAANGTSRPVAYARVVSTDAETAADEAENKSLSKAVW